jgi:hypothetical protein
MTEPNYVAFTKFSIFAIFTILTIITVFTAICRVPLSQVRLCAQRQAEVKDLSALRVIIIAS